MGGQRSAESFLTSHIRLSSPERTSGLALMGWQWWKRGPGGGWAGLGGSRVPSPESKGTR